MYYYIQVPQKNKPAFILNSFLGLQEAIRLAKNALTMFSLKSIEIIDMETHSITLTLTPDGKNGTPETV